MSKSVHSVQNRENLNTQQLYLSREEIIEIKVAEVVLFYLRLNLNNGKLRRHMIISRVITKREMVHTF